MSDVQLWKGAIAPATAVAAVSAIVLTLINGQSGLSRFATAIPPSSSLA